MIALWNDLAAQWWAWMWPMFWQVGLLVAVLAPVDILLRRWVWPQLRFALWFLIPLKLMLPPGLASPLGLTGSVPTTASPGGANTTAPAEITLHPEAWLFALWITGVGLLTWGFLRSLRRRRTQLLEGSSPAPASLRVVLEDAARRLNLRRAPRLLLVPSLPSPAVFGLFRPVVLLPDDAPHTLTSREMEQVLLHELAHIKRGDLWISALFSALMVGYWFQPWLWLVRRRLVTLREICCDSTVVRVAPESVEYYRSALVRSARVLLERPHPPLWGQLGWAREEASIILRLRWLGRGGDSCVRLRQSLVTALLVGAVIFVLPLAPNRVVGEGVPVPTEARPSVARITPPPEVAPEIQEAFLSPGCIRQRHAVLYWMHQQNQLDPSSMETVPGP